MIIKLNSPQFDEFVKLCGRQECQGAKKQHRSERGDRSL
jgi:hypothetical protein